MRFSSLAGTTAAVVLAAGTLAGCGGGSAAADEETAKKNIKASLQKDDLAGGSLTDKQADCLAGKLVEDVGVDKLQEYKLLTKDLTVNEDLSKTTMNQEDADAAAGAFTGCVDATELVEKQFASAASGMSDKQRACISDVLTEDKVEEMLSLTFQGKDDQIGAGLRQDLGKCVAP